MVADLGEQSAVACSVLLQATSTAGWEQLKFIQPNQPRAWLVPVFGTVVAHLISRRIGSLTKLFYLFLLFFEKNSSSYSSLFLFSISPSPCLLLFICFCFPLLQPPRLDFDRPSNGVATGTAIRRRSSEIVVLAPPLLEGLPTRDRALTLHSLLLLLLLYSTMLLLLLVCVCVCVCMRVWCQSILRQLFHTRTLHTQTNAYI